jgi:hypothetical protein
MCRFAAVETLSEHCSMVFFAVELMHAHRLIGLFLDGVFTLEIGTLEFQG